jgi:hypothetical protein
MYAFLSAFWSSDLQPANSGLSDENKCKRIARETDYGTFDICEHVSRSRTLVNA